MAQYIKKKTFIKVMRGYSPEEVDAYIEYLLTKYHEIAKENDDNKRKVAIALRKIQELSEKNPEAAAKLRAEAVPAGPSAEARAESAELIETAKAERQKILEGAAKQAEKILKDAETEARRKAVEMTAEAQKTVREAELYAQSQYDMAQKLYSEVFSFRDKLFGMYNDHIEMLENIAEEANAYFDNVADAGVMLGDEAEDGQSAEPPAAEEEPAETEVYEQPAAVPVYTEPEPDAGYAEPADEADESDPAASLPPAAEEDAADDIIPDDLLSDADVTEGEVAEYLSLMSEAEPEDEEIAIRINWNSHKTKKQDPEVLSSFEYEEEPAAEPKRTAAEPKRKTGGKNDFHDFDDLLENGGKSRNDFSLTDEFDIVYSSRNSTKNVEEIVRQPLVAPERPSNPKKHRKY